MRRSALLLCLLALLASPAAAQDATDAAGAAPAEVVQAEDAATATVDAQPAPASSGLPPVAPPPRTLRAYWHVFIAFAVAWGLLFGYAILLARKGGALERQLKRLEGTGA